MIFDLLCPMLFIAFVLLSYHDGPDHLYHILHIYCSVIFITCHLMPISCTFKAVRRFPDGLVINALFIFGISVKMFDMLLMYLR